MFYIFYNKLSIFLVIYNILSYIIVDVLITTYVVIIIESMIAETTRVNYYKILDNWQLLYNMNIFEKNNESWQNTYWHVLYSDYI